MLNEVGEEFVNELFSDFSCPLNDDVVTLPRFYGHAECVVQ